MMLSKFTHELTCLLNSIRQAWSGEGQILQCPNKTPIGSGIRQQRTGRWHMDWNKAYNLAYET